MAVHFLYSKYDETHSVNANSDEYETSRLIFTKETDPIYLEKISAVFGNKIPF